MDDQPGSAPVEHDAAKRFGRRTTLKLLGAAIGGMAAGAAGPAAASNVQNRSAAPSPDATRRHPSWRLRPLASGETPRSFTPAEMLALGAVVDRIIPDTDTPGARTAGVHWYLDDVCAVERRLRDELRQGLRRLDEHARRRGRSFAELSPEAQDEILRSLDEPATGSVAVDNAGRPQVTGAAVTTGAVTPEDRSFFSTIRARTIDAYYKSEMGQIGELEWVGHEFHDTFPGRCEHADPLDHPRPRWPRSRA